MHKVVNPQILIPMHGEHRHLRRHTELGEKNGIKSVIAPNGTMVDLAGNEPKIVEFVETGRTYLDGRVQIGALDGVVRDRIRMALNGHVVCTVIVEDNAPLGDAWVEVMGLPAKGVSRAPLVDVLEEDVNQYLMRAGRKTLADDDKLEKELVRILRKSGNDEVGKKPEVTVIISRLSS
jgi:ribonuclease J